MTCAICDKEITYRSSWQTRYALPMRNGEVVWSGKWAGLEVHRECYDRYWDEHRNQPRQKRSKGAVV